MCDTNNLIKDVAIDIICLTTMWNLLHNPYMALNYYSKLDNKFNEITTTCLMVFGVGVSALVVKKYL